MGQTYCITEGHHYYSAAPWDLGNELVFVLSPLCLFKLRKRFDDNFTVDVLRAGGFTIDFASEDNQSIVCFKLIAMEAGNNTHIAFILNFRLICSDNAGQKANYL